MSDEGRNPGKKLFLNAAGEVTAPCLLNAEGKKPKLVYTGKGLSINKAKPRKTVKKAAAKPARKPSK